MVDKDQDAILSKIYFDPAGHGSINQTLKEAKAYDNTVTYDYMLRIGYRGIQNVRLI